MFFTREDINKIYQALLKLGIKDSELPETSDVKNDDTLAIVQDGKNKQINVREFLNQISLWKREDFINVTDKYKKSHITLVEAIQAIPIVQRKEGLVITFLDNESNWRIYQFRGSLLQFNNETLWVDLYDFSPYIIDSILPDEEDITQSAIDKQGNTYLSLKDREYNPSEFSGKGYKILRKNIIEIEDENSNKVKKNILTKEMISEPNTVYEIRYDFDLNGKEITIPENCVLKFNGGSIHNGTLVANNCKIDSKEDTIFYNIIFKGIWKVYTIYTAWFNFNITEIVDNKKVFKELQSLINCCKDGCTLYFKKGVYYTGLLREPNGYKDGLPIYPMNDYAKDEDYVLRIDSIPFIDIHLNGAEIKALNIYSPGWYMIGFYNVENGFIHDGKLTGMGFPEFPYSSYINYTGNPTNNYEFGVLLEQNGGFLTIDNMEVTRTTSDGISVGSGDFYNEEEKKLLKYDAKGYIISNSEISYVGRNGIWIKSSLQGELKNLYIHNCGSDAGDGVIGSDGIMGKNPRTGIDVEMHDFHYLQPVMKWDNIKITDCGKTCVSFASSSISKTYSLNINNLQAIGGCTFNNVNSTTSSIIQNSYIEYNLDSTFLRFGDAVVNNCTFIIKTPVSYYIKECNNCKIIDKIENSNTKVLLQSGNTSIFNHCIFDFKHSTFLNAKELNYCTINNLAEENSNYLSYYISGTTLNNCKFSSINNNNISFQYLNVPGDLTLNNCTINNLSGSSTSTAVSDSGIFSSEMNITFNKCIFKKDSKFCKSKKNIIINNCIFEMLSIVEYLNTNETTLSFYNCNCPSIDISANLVPYIIDNSYFLFPENSYNTKFIAKNSYLKYNSGSYGTENIKLINCIVDGNLTEDNFKGINIGSTFIKSIPKKGSTTERPNLAEDRNGFQYYDTTLKKYIVWNGTEWTNMDGKAL